MKDVSLMSRAKLVCALITSTTMTAKAAVTYAKTRDPVVSGNRDALVAYKLAVARELLLRDLAERMKSEPVLSAPTTVRDWLRMYCANLEHECIGYILMNNRRRLWKALGFRTIPQVATTRPSGIVRERHKHINRWVPLTYSNCRYT